MLAPICLFTYNRLKETQQTIEALKNNYLASESELYVFSDGWKNEISKNKVIKIRDFLRTVNGFKSIRIEESSYNKGLANSIIYGATQIIRKHEKIIVLEDDLVTAPNFLNFMNQALDFYVNNPKIFSITGYSLNLPKLKTYNKDFYLGYRASSWGWGTWKNRWDSVDWEVKNYNHFKYNFSDQCRFMRGGSDMPSMLKNQMNGRIDSWAIRWCYNQFKQNTLTVFPSRSKLISIGFTFEATHTKKTNRFYTDLDSSNQTTFKFDTNPVINEQITNELRNKYSILNRLKDKLFI
ncbi:glycosyltransferase [Prolixibacteraceae bacterium Z1-6]|uniref:Glycosyltransferase n=1 Tax=Draconibacterium aestuarii TaxID=2998507 RepID=A0A9X3J715_9BACT|nr:glycosyltransferase [Prolixibacteraceae bacterium Z1-6]